VPEGSGEERMTKSVESRLIDRRFIDSNGCWNWLGAKLRGGYGNIHIDDKSCQVHRVSYMKWVGQIPEGMLVCHKCDNPACYNPEHLFLGTYKDNARDKCNKNRQAKGSDIYQYKLDEDKVRKIRCMASDGISRRKIAKEFGVGSTIITYIVNRKVAKWVE
jgi:hypothetical protein